MRKHLAQRRCQPRATISSKNNVRKSLRRLVGGIPRRDHITTYRLAFGWLSARRRCQYVIGLQAFKVVANANPPYLTERFNCRLNVDLDLPRSDRHPPQPFEPPPRRTEAYKHSLALDAMDLLNSIRFTNFAPANLSFFKRTLRETLFNRDVIDWNSRVRNEGQPTYLLYRLPTPAAIPRPRL